MSSNSRTEIKFENFRVAVCDLNGIWRGKRLPVRKLSTVLDQGTRIPLSTSCIDVWGCDLVDSPFLFKTGDGDGTAIPTGKKTFPVNWLDNSTAMIPCWIFDDKGKPSKIDPRQILQSVIKKYSYHGLRPVMALELEFYLLDPLEKTPINAISPLSRKRSANTSVLSIDDLDEFEHFFSEVYTACEDYDIPVDSAISENSAGQFEINLTHSENVLNAADQAVFFKRLLKGIAKKHSLVASFMAKPFLDRAGSGMHLHFSIVDDSDQNIFNNGTEEGSMNLKHAVGGLIKAMPDSTLVFAPHLNSYKRLKEGSHAPTSICWGYENRTASIRIPGGNLEDIRIEHRVAGADANPYLVSAAILAAALKGIEDNCKPPVAIRGDSYQKPLPQIPSDWLTAISLFKNSQLNKLLYPPLFGDVFSNCKLQEYNTFANRLEDFEVDTYRDTI
ncbi:MAG: glutamine synthetase family protein [Pseudomonadota bacterium]|nr:glutamine synthetase family protein [Pseudomonadota bacterium]